jgi:hypothetical protein
MKKAKKLDKEYRQELISLTITMEECILIMDALAGFKPRKKWYDLYQEIGSIFFYNLEKIDLRKHLVPDEERGFQQIRE